MLQLIKMVCNNCSVSNGKLTKLITVVLSKEDYPEENVIKLHT